MSFAKNFNRICSEKGITPTALLKNMKISTSKVTMWNNGSLPKEDMLIALSKELGCSVIDFFLDDNELERSVLLNEDERDIIRIYKMLSRKTKHEFMASAYNFEKEEDERRNSCKSSEV